MLVVVCIGAYLIALFRCGRRSLDLNELVPLLLGCGGLIASGKLIFASFVVAALIEKVPKFKDELAIVDTQMILIAGAIFLLLSFYQIVATITGVGNDDQE